ncbi:MAG: Na(+)-translocating NADH-quinone reductase subunit A [Gammaproteobacteria bacterium]|nr:Na(+)-translocating NADH-quinone reductase subunit A [Gammaproteobacteria bacterium]
MLFRIKKGLDIPIRGAPEQVISPGAAVTSVALLGDDYIGLRPAMLVSEGDPVKLGQPIFENRKHAEIKFTSPGSGVVIEINRGARRVLESIVIELHDDGEEVLFSAYPQEKLALLKPGEVIDNLLTSGLWTALRTRPFSKVPEPGSEPHSIFVTAMDSNPLAPRPDVVIDTAGQDFDNGLKVVSRLTPGRVFFCRQSGANLPKEDPDTITVAEFTGPHPSGLVGTHIHFLDPVGTNKTVWHLNYQDVIAIGRLFTTGRLCMERIVALGGPVMHRPRLIRTRIGANIDDLLRDEVQDVAYRVTSGSLLAGRQTSMRTQYLGRYHNQVSTIAEANHNEHWVGATSARNGRRVPKVSVLGSYRSQEYGFTTALHGKPAPMLPIGTFERVMPMDILPTQLLRALVIGDTDTAQALGCLELDEEDLALCSYVCPSKYDYGPLLRSSLSQIESEI